jgi:TRAP-type mannitol/chloroaromatic compound transport system permease small subunit
VKIFLRWAERIDTLNERVGRLVLWLVGIVTVISAVNALVRYGFNASSNAWLEIQWYGFAAMILLAAPYTLKHNGHVRIDAIYGRLQPITRAWIDLLGTLVFLLPLCVLMTWLSWPNFVDSFRSGELSPDAGGLVRWPVKLLIPLGFALLGLQGLSELIKRVGFLRGQYPLTHEKPVVEE